MAVYIHTYLDTHKFNWWSDFISPINQWINQWINQSTNQPTNLSTHSPIHAWLVRNMYA